MTTTPVNFAPPPVDVQTSDVSRARSADAGSSAFEEGLLAIVSSTDGIVKDADKLVDKGVRGQADLHEVALALEEADVSMRLMMKARNKVVEAYQEVMRMAI